jgi:GGDEF domain-containing protein
MAEKQKKDQKKEKELIQRKTGYDPAHYHRMAFMFILLSVVNIAFVTLAFSHTGFGLYRAEDALSHISDITQSVHRINECAQNIVIHADDPDVIDRETHNINLLFGDIERESAVCRQIDLTEFDERLKRHFDNASMDTMSYQRALTDFLEQIHTGELSDPEEIEEAYTSVIEPLNNTAEISMNIVFDTQSKATYDFFVWSARQFLFILLFLLFNMTVGLIGIHSMQKKARKADVVVKQEHEKVEKLREKTVDIAYSHILTGFKNYYGLEKDLTAEMDDREFSIALFRFNKFYQINEIFGRGRADEFVAEVSQALAQKYSEDAVIYSTAIAEFCFVFKKKLTQMQQDDLVRMISETMSGSYSPDGVMISQTVSCCHYSHMPRAKESFENMFNKLDRALSIAKEQNAMHGQNVIINVNTLVGA